MDNQFSLFAAPEEPDSFTQHKQQFLALVDAGAIVVVNHSGGKDSQAMYLLMRKYVPANQLKILHADLTDDCEWIGVKDHIKNTTDGLELNVALANYKDQSSKTLLGEVQRKKKWPDAKRRWCTSDFKRGPCQREMRRMAKEHFKGGREVVISVMGLRAQESAARSKKPVWKDLEDLNTQNRIAYEFNPILTMTETQVFAQIEKAGQKPHYAYGLGMDRLSCMFCVLAPAKQLALSARLNPEAAQKYVNIEAAIGHSFKTNQTLADITGVQPTI